MAFAMSLTCLICSIGGGSADSAEREVLRSRRIKDKQVSDRSAKRKAVRITEMAESGAHDLLSGSDAEAKTAAAAIKESTDEQKLTELAKKVIDELQTVMISRDLPKLKEMIAQIMANPRAFLGMAAVPVAVRQAMVSALGACGGPALESLMDFMTDPDPAVAKSATQSFELSIQDPKLSDRERSVLVIGAAEMINDPLEMTCLLANLSKMRHSVWVETVSAINETGTDAARSQLAERIHFYTGDYDIQSIEELPEWLEKNPDKPWDDGLYGGR